MGGFSLSHYDIEYGISEKTPLNKLFNMQINSGQWTTQRH